MRVQRMLAISDLILSRHLVYFGHTLRARVRLLIKVHNLQTDRQSLEIQPSHMQNPAYFVRTVGGGGEEVAAC